MCDPSGPSVGASRPRRRNGSLPSHSNKGGAGRRKRAICRAPAHNCQRKAPHVEEETMLSPRQHASASAFRLGLASPIPTAPGPPSGRRIEAPLSRSGRLGDSHHSRASDKWLTKCAAIPFCCCCFNPWNPVLPLNTFTLLALISCLFLTLVGIALTIENELIMTRFFEMLTSPVHFLWTVMLVP